MTQHDVISGYRQITVGPRSPRVLIVLPRDPMWPSHAAIALWIASRTWGGSGFAFTAADAAKTPDVVLRAIAAYDPDHVVGMSYTNQELWELGIKDRPADLAPEAVDVYAKSITRITTSDDIAAGCSPYLAGRDEATFREVTSIGAEQETRRLRTSRPLEVEVEVALANPSLPTGLLGLMVGMRSGYTTRPPVPYPSPAARPLDPDTRGWLGFAMSGQPTQRAPDAFGMANPDAWSSTETGLGWVSQPVARPRRLVVVGDSVDDFALAVTWDRMRGHSSAMWIPTAMLADADSCEVVGNVLLTAALELEPRGGSLLASSATLAPGDVRANLDQALRAAKHLMPSERCNITYIGAAQLRFAPTHYLACVPEDYDIRYTLPTITGRDGGVELAAQIPARVPQGLEVLPGMRPDWQVDVWGVRPRAAVAGRGLASDRLLVRNDDWTVTRSSRAGISFEPMDTGFVAAAASLRQSIAEPTLRFPGLLEWTGAIVAPAYSVLTSEAGHRSQLCADVVGTRDLLIESILEIHPLLVEFTRPTSADRDFPDRDGLRVAGVGNVLTFAGCERTLKIDADHTRELLDSLLERGVLLRGLVLRCGYCSSRDFYTAEELAQRYRCRRCTNRTDLTRESWTGPDAEPIWYYNLHGAFRDLINSNGDVPLLGARYLSAKTPHYIDIAEIEFRATDPTKRSAEIDLIAVMDGELIVAEAKRAPTAVKGKRSLNKLVHVAAEVQADTIMLMSGTPDPWPSYMLDHLQKQLEAHTYVGGRRPRLTTLTNLYLGGVETET